MHYVLPYVYCIVTVCQPLKFNHRVIQRLKRSLECYKGPLGAILWAITSFLVGRFHCFYRLAERRTYSQQPCRAHTLPTYWIYTWATRAIYMRCKIVFNEWCTQKEREWERANKMKALALTRVFIWLCLLSAMDPMRPHAPGICIANGATYFTPSRYTV